MNVGTEILNIFIYWPTSQWKRFQNKKRHKTRWLTQVTLSNTSTVQPHSTYIANMFPSFNTKFKRLEPCNFNVTFFSVSVFKTAVPKRNLI
jgi:hypothetical protein